MVNKHSEVDHNETYLDAIETAINANHAIEMIQAVTGEKASTIRAKLKRMGFLNSSNNTYSKTVSLRK